MRSLLIALVLIVAGSIPLQLADAHAAGQSATPPAIEASFGTSTEVDPDEDRVPVQLVVLGIVLGTVFVLGTAAFLLRRRLGLTAYTPPADSGHH